MKNYISLMALSKWIYVIPLLLLIVSCSKDKDKATNFPIEKKISFVKTSATLDRSSANPMKIELLLSQPLESEGTVTISIDKSSTAASSDYSTIPSVSEGKIVLSLAKGANAASFTLTANNQDGGADKTISFKISDAIGGVKLANSQLTMTVTLIGDKEPSDFGLVFTENFDYGLPGGLITDLSEWERYGGKVEPIVYTPDGLTFTGYPADAGGSIIIANGPEVREDIERSIEPQTTGVIYTAQLVNVSSASSTGEYFYYLRDDGGNGGIIARLYAQDDGNGNLQFGTVLNVSGGGSVSYSSTLYDYNTTYLVVVKYDFEAGVSSMFVIKDSIPSEEPDIPDASVNTGNLPTSLDGIRYRQNKGSLVVTVDGVRIAKTWKGVLGIKN